MENIQDYLERNHDNDEACEPTIEQGFQYGLIITNKILAHPDINKCHLSIFGTSGDGTSGVFMQNSYTLRGIRITMNRTYCSALIYFGDCNSLPYPYRIPDMDYEGLESYNYDEDELDTAVDKIIEYLSVEDYSAIKILKEKQKENI
jgi:hypothetical protein